MSSGNVGGVFGMVFSPIMFLLNNWYIFVIALLLAIAIGVIIYFIASTKDLKRERDEAGYFLYKKTVKDCINGRDPKRYKKTYSFWKNMFWFGIPIRMKDESKFVFNKYGEKIGRYRGHVRSQDGTYNLLVCVGTTFRIIDNNILIKVPQSLKIKEGDKVKTVSFNLIKEDTLDKSITIDCIGTERTALFYYMPIFTMNDNGKETTVDLREHMESTVADSTYQVMLQRMLNTGQKQMEKAMTFNPHLKYEQMSPEKTAPEQDLDNYGK